MHFIHIDITTYGFEEDGIVSQDAFRRVQVSVIGTHRDLHLVGFIRTYDGHGARLRIHANLPRFTGCLVVHAGRTRHLI